MHGDFRSFEKKPDGDQLTLKIAVGVCVGILASSFVIWAATELRVRWEIDQAAHALRAITEKANREIEQSRRDDAARVQAQQQHQARERQAVAEHQRAVDQAKRDAFIEADRREAAWKRHYKPSSGCALAGQSVECSNEFIRAKRSFEAQYRPGRQ